MVPRHSMLIDSVKDIVLGNFLWGEPEYNNVSKRALYFNLEDPWQSQLENRFRNLTSDTSTAALRSGKFVFPVQRFGYSYVFIDVDGLETNDLREFRLMKQTLNEFYVSFKFSKQSPLLDILNLLALRITSKGINLDIVEQIVSKRPDLYSSFEIGVPTNIFWDIYLLARILAE
ncbi:hypothetical protein J6590_013208 [Homalodisca vitripennis]|nr:hypothetical protein J6590_013208 [Homalodisca vitripennis]